MSSTSETWATRQTRLRHPGVCRGCGRGLDEGAVVYFDPASVSVRCPSCHRGALVVPTQRGAADESCGVLDGALDGLDGVRVLRDRRGPGADGTRLGRVAVTAVGVWALVGERRYGHRARRRVRGVLGAQPRLQLGLGQEDRTVLVDAVNEQAAVVAWALATSGLTRVPVRGGLCLADATWSPLGDGFGIDGVEVAAPHRLAARLTADGPLDETSRLLAFVALDTTLGRG